MSVKSMMSLKLTLLQCQSMLIIKSTVSMSVNNVIKINFALISVYIDAKINCVNVSLLCH